MICMLPAPVPHPSVEKHNYGRAISECNQCENIQIDETKSFHQLNLLGLETLTALHGECHFKFLYLVELKKEKKKPKSNYSCSLYFCKES